MDALKRPQDDLLCRRLFGSGTKGTDKNGSQ